MNLKTKTRELYKQRDKQILAMWIKGKGRWGLKSEMAIQFDLTRQQIGNILKRLLEPDKDNVDRNDSD